MRHVIIAVTLLLHAGSPASAPTFASEAWQANEATYQAILQHPFLEQMRSGRLDRQIFAGYLVQDAHYLGVFARVLDVLAAKAPRADWARRLAEDARGSLAEERRLQRRLLESYGIDADRLVATEPSPDAFGYANYLLATAHDRPFAEGVAALLPCYWIYWEVGKQLATTGSPDPVYQAWIESYADPGYGQAVDAFLAIVNAAAADTDPDTVARMHEHFRRASRYEWLFWDSAFHGRGWPLAARPSAPASSAGGR